MEGNSAPGPDGIAYHAWKGVGDTGLEVFWEALQELQQEQAEERFLQA